MIKYPQTQKSLQIIANRLEAAKKTKYKDIDQLFAEVGIKIVDTWDGYDLKPAIPKAKLKEVADKFIKLGAKRQAPKAWYPVSEKEADNDFGDDEMIGDYMLFLKDSYGNTVEFSIKANGKSIDYVIN